MEGDDVRKPAASARMPPPMMFDQQAAEVESGDVQQLKELLDDGKRFARPAAPVR